jgi:hypothetical protein
MKKIKFFILAALFSVSMAATASEGETTNTIEPGERAIQIENRVHEIWKMDYSKMDKVEKLALKSELKAIKKEMKAEGLDDKVSISIGAIVIIILLLIII